MKSLNILVVMLLVSASVFGQTTIDSKQEKPFIEVTGLAEKEIIPDEIYISITIKERHDGREKISIEKQEADLKVALKSIDVSLDNLSLSDANANYIRVKWKKKDVITKTEYILKVENALTVGKVFEKLDELKIVDAHIAKVSHSKILDFKKEVRVLAIKAAKEKADYLLEAIGQQTGKALKVQEVKRSRIEDDAYLNVRGGRNMTFYNTGPGIEQSSSKKVVLQFQRIKLQAAIYVKFEIE